MSALLALALALLAPSADAGQVPSLSIAFQVADEAVAIAERLDTFKIVATPTDRPPKPDAFTVEVPLESLGPSSLTLPDGDWRVEVVADGLWSNPAEISVAKRDTIRHVALRVWPSATIRARASVPNGYEMPDVMAVNFRPPPGVEFEDPPKRTLRCPIRDGEFECELPAGTWDLRFLTPPWAPQFSWRASAPAGEETDLGRLSLTLGGSLTGWVTAPAGTAPAGARVALYQAGTAQLSPSERARAATRELTATTNEDGFFEISGIAPGDFIVEARKDGLAVSKASVKIAPGHHIELVSPGLALEPEISLDVFVSPGQAPGAQPWRLILHEQIGAGTPEVKLVRVHDGPVSLSGAALVTGLEAGEYKAVLMSGEQAWWTDTIQAGGAHGPLIVDLPVVEIAGTVLLDGDPLPKAKLHFGGFSGQPRVTIHSDGDGYFFGAVPRPGSWLVGVHSAGAGIRRELEVDVDLQVGRQPERIRIEIEDHAITGKVAMADGRAVESAIVTAVYEDRRMTYTTTDELGHYEVRGLPEGAVQLSASASRSRVSEVHTVDVTNGDSVRQDLVLSERRTITGRVYSEAGSVVGARVLPTPVGVATLGISYKTTDSRGEFEFHVPQETAAVALQVEAPGFAVRLLTVPLDGVQDVPILVGQDSGTLTIRAPADLEDRHLAIVHDGFAWPATMLAHLGDQAAGTVDSSVVNVAGLAPGEYWACSMTGEEISLIHRGMAIPKLAACRSGHLGANSTLELNF